MNQPVFTIYDPDFWEEQWKALNAVPTAFCGYGSKETWNTMARDYGRNRDPDDLEDRVDMTLARLEKNGVMFENANVLDIGCGTGRYAAAFARRGARVTAVDISENMIERLRAETDRELLARITPLVADWKTLNNEVPGYTKAFDLVFANMTPAVMSPASFKKLMSASKHWCWFRGWAGPRNNPLHERLYRAVYAKEPQQFTGSFICVWNLACALGYFPDCSFETIGWTEKKTVDAHVEWYSLFFFRNGTLEKETIAPLLRASLSEIAVDGVVENTVSGHTGSMLWSVDN